jgi:hypothetical protein
MCGTQDSDKHQLPVRDLPVSKVELCYDPSRKRISNRFGQLTICSQTYRRKQHGVVYTCSRARQTGHQSVWVEQVSVISVHLGSAMNHDQDSP